MHNVAAYAPRRQSFQKRITTDQKLRHKTVTPCIELRTHFFKPPDGPPVERKHPLPNQQFQMYLLSLHLAPGMRPITFFRNHNSHSNGGDFSASTSAITWFKPIFSLPHGMRNGSGEIPRPLNQFATLLPTRLLKRFISVVTPTST